MGVFYMVEWENKPYRKKFYTSIDINEYTRIVRQDKLKNILK